MALWDILYIFSKLPTKILSKLVIFLISQTEVQRDNLLVHISSRGHSQSIQGQS